MATSAMGGLVRPDMPVQVFIKGRPSTTITATATSAHQPQRAAPASSQRSVAKAAPAQTYQSSAEEQHRWDEALSTFNRANNKVQPTSRQSGPAAKTEKTDKTGPERTVVSRTARQGSGWSKPTGTGTTTSQVNTTSDEPAATEQATGASFQRDTVNNEPPANEFPTESTANDQQDTSRVNVLRVPTQTDAQGKNKGIQTIINWTQCCRVTADDGNSVCRASASLVIKLCQEKDSGELKAGFKFRYDNLDSRNHNWTDLEARDFIVTDENQNRKPVCVLKFGKKRQDGSKVLYAYTLEFTSLDLVDELKERIKTVQDIISLSQTFNHPSAQAYVQDHGKQLHGCAELGAVSVESFIEHAVKHMATHNKIEYSALTERLTSLFQVVFIMSLEERIRESGIKVAGEELSGGKTSPDQSQPGVRQKRATITNPAGEKEEEMRKNQLVPTAQTFVPQIDVPSMPKAQASAEMASSLHFPGDTGETSVTTDVTAVNPTKPSNDNSIVEGKTSSGKVVEATREGDEADVQTTVSVQSLVPNRGSQEDGTAIGPSEAQNTGPTQRQAIEITTTEIRRTARLVKRTITVEQYVYDESTES